jgi:hypothetical protein
MYNEQRNEDAAASRGTPDSPVTDGTPLSRRQAIGRLSALATAGAAAWVVPEILTAQPAGGATLSAVTSAATVPATSAPTTGPRSHASPATALAYTGLNIQRDAEIGAALIAGGWALHHWASRAPAPAPAPQAEAPADPT